jgi:chromosome segregation protein
LLPDGVSYHGHAVSGGKKTGGGPLALKRELRELSQVVAGRQRAVDEITAALEALEREIAMLSEDLEELRQRQQAEEKDKLALDHDQRKMAEELARAASRLSISRMELERLQREDGRSREQREKNQVLVAEREQSRFEQEMALAAARAELEALQAQAHRIAEEHAALRAELAGLEERRRGEANARIRLEAQLREIETRREDLGREVERMGVERARLLADNIELDQRSAQLALEIENASTAVNELSGHETEQRAALVALEESLKELRGDVQVAQEKRGQVELELVRRQGDLRYLDETARKELGEAAQTIAAAFETVPEGDALAEIEQKCQDVRARIEAMGPVNPQALEEFEEAQKRYDFLNAQRQDLLDSIRDTEKAIHDIDQESRKRFAEAFEAINTNFRETFRTLFGGGTGEMRLTDETNLAECGIDIVASPPGKKLQNVLLLSGGEKSLTAMALLMAIFRYQPSPFCVLDEVDAALDEANTMRLTRLLQDISMQTQVIMITHARRTMESASTLYGVTMQEPGVSTLVSVKFEPAPASTTPVAVGATA